MLSDNDGSNAFSTFISSIIYVTKIFIGKMFGKKGDYVIGIALTPGNHLLLADVLLPTYSSGPREELGNVNYVQDTFIVFTHLISYLEL